MMFLEPKDTLEIQQQEILESRVAGSITVGQIVEKLGENYDFNGREPQYFSPLYLGLESQKYTFWAGKEAFLLKIYGQDLSQGNRFRLRNVMGFEQKLIAAGIPFSASLPTKDGKYFLINEARCGISHRIEVAFGISRVFPGKALTNPSLADIAKMTEYMTKIHQIEPGVVPAVDSWSFLRFVRENDIYAYPVPIFYNQKFVPEIFEEVLKKIMPTVKAMRKLNLEDRSQFPKTIVHGDLHSFNILKNPTKGILILDPGCLDYLQRIIDPVVFMTNTCADFRNLDLTLNRFQETIRAYEEYELLTPQEKAALPTLMKANYAMFSLRTAELLQEDPENKEIREWHEHGLQGLAMMDQLNFKVI